MRDDGKTDVFARDMEVFFERTEAMLRQMALLRLEAREVSSPAAHLVEQALEQMQTIAEELRVAQEELRQQHDELLTANETIAAERERYRDLFENAPDGYVVTDMRGIMREANRAAHSLLQTAGELLVGKPLANRVAPPERPAFRALINKLSRIASLPEREVRFQPPHRSPLETAVTVTVIADHEGKPTGLRWIIRDIRLRKRAAQLEAEQTHILTENVRLHQAVYESSHRIKNHLQALAATVDMQLMEGKDLLPAEEFKRLGSQVRTLAAIHDLLTVDIKANQTENQVSAQALLQKALTMLHEAVGVVPIRFEIEDFPLALKPAVSLTLVVNELVSNALKHGNGTPVEVTFTVSEGTARLEVCDDGPGFPEGFDAETAAHTGLELIAQLTQTDLRGQVRYANRKEGGARVCVTFPIA